MLFSIIIPHFNSAISLKKLIKTIPNRNDIEIIIIDDNSENIDFKHEIEHHCTIKFYRNDSNNKGAGACRNIGLIHATGQWLIFADSDDYFLDNAFDTIVTTLQNDVDIMYFSPTSKCLITGQDSDRHVFYQGLVNNYIINNNPDIRYRFIVPWSKIYSRTFITKNRIVFDEVLASNDVMFSLKSGHLAEKIHASRLPIYCVTRGKGTLTVNRTKAVLQSRFNVEMDRLSYIQQHDITCIRNALSSLLLQYSSILSITFLSTIIKAYFDKKITLVPATYSIYIKKPNLIWKRLQKNKMSDKNDRYK
ncbi:glycosyltransferase family 2 protein [Shewanella frigidimarina]|uniref:Glycosyltransferase 2-like domain-containing protein n=1 Tax=Shewanella frigidimarina TaxID=56812 RepID=A0A119D0V0_SHEFR|nr:glycosyltransferase [Shewanella frigidimarina]KVX03518.1 hypothetical protein AWJ07_02880 [Shewanella frigidimarina]